MTFNDFVSTWNGRGADFDGWYGDQCVDLFNYYNRDVVGAPFVWCNYASELWDNAMNAAPGYYIQIKNAPGNHPEAGDVVIWRGNGHHTGAAGHVAIATGNFDGEYEFESFDQNWPTGSLPHHQWHDYYDVIGWLRPVSSETVSPPSDSTEVPETPPVAAPSLPEVEPSAPTPVETVPVETGSLDESTEQPSPSSVPDESEVELPLPASPKTPDLESSSTPLTPPVSKPHTVGMRNIVLQKLTSRKFLLSLAALITLAANHQWTEFVATLFAYLGAQGWVDASR